MKDAEQADRPDGPVAKARCVFTLLTPMGLPGGKVSGRRFLTRFCADLRQSGYVSVFCASLEEVRVALSEDQPAILVHLYGEDRYQILSPEVEAQEGRALAVFNSARIGPLLADKRASHLALRAAGVPMPEIDPAHGMGFERRRTGSALPTALVPDVTAKDWTPAPESLLTGFVDTRVAFRGRAYFTTVRLMCVDDVILHAFPRARDAAEGNPSVHSRNTPLDPELIEHLNRRLIEPHGDVFAEIAAGAHRVLGHGFYGHDLLVDRETGALTLCETGFKFDDLLYVSHLAPIRHRIPSQAPLYPVKGFAALSAKAFIAAADKILAPAAPS